MTLVADDGLFPNRTLRETAAGPIMLGLVTPRYRRVIIDEFHQGFATSGTSLAGATLAWSARSPWGWIVWQLVAVGVIAWWLRHPVRPGAAGHPPPPPLPTGARPRARHGAGGGARPRDGGASHGAGASPPAVPRGPDRAHRPRSLARRTWRAPCARSAAMLRSQP